MASRRLDGGADWQILTCRKYALPAIFLPQAHVRTSNACFCARDTLGFFSARFATPYSLTSHFTVAGSISDVLISSPCFLQNSSKDLSVTNESTSFSWPAEIRLCTWGKATPRRSATRSHENASSALFRAAATLSRTEGSQVAPFFSQNAVSEVADMRASRTLSRPVPMRYLSRAGLTRNNVRKARSDQPSVTLALIPSAPSRKRTALTERPKR